MKIIRILVADDQLLTREGIRTILDLEDDMDVVGVARDGLEACELAVRLRPDLVLLDIQMPNMDGISALKRIRTELPDCAVLILTTFMEENYILEGMACGASGYLLKDMDGDKMIRAIRDAAAGQFVLPANVAAKLAGSVIRLRAEQQLRGSLPQSGMRRFRLTEREQEIARLVTQGLNNREIADTLNVTEGTARNYISTLYSKLEVNDRAQAIALLHSML